VVKRHPLPVNPVSVNPVPVNAVPVNADPANADLANADLVKAVPANAAPVKPVPVKEGPINGGLAHPVRIHGGQHKHPIRARGICGRQVPSGRVLNAAFLTDKVTASPLEAETVLALRVQGRLRGRVRGRAGGRRVTGRAIRNRCWWRRNR